MEIMMTRYIEELGISPITTPFHAFLLKNRPADSTELPTHMAIIEGKEVPFDLWIEDKTNMGLLEKINEVKGSFTVISLPQSKAIHSIGLNPALNNAPPPRAFRHTLGVLGI
ncbi:MAG: hypothetical protein PHW63_00355 [Alphaproteobacteria bacterium]|nr:hypothetical protein [Alphaproteobacteria bacterium]